MAKLMAGPIAATMTGRHRCGCYFLWPTSFQDGTEDQSGMVPHGAYFDAVKGFEAAGLPTRFPHPSQLYRTLLAKELGAQEKKSRALYRLSSAGARSSRGDASTTAVQEQNV